MSDRDQLVASYFTLTGAPVGAPARFPFEERIAAASAAGFSGVGLLGEAYAEMRASGVDDRQILRLLDGHGVRITEVEFAFGWSSDDPAAVVAENTLLAMADVFAPHHLTCGDLRRAADAPPLEVTIERFAALCDRAADHGTRVALEFLPWSTIPDLRTAWAIVDGAGRSNGGVLLDAWHYFRGTPDDALLRSLPSSAFVGVQLDDTDAPVGPAMEDTILRRRLPGAGTFDLVGLVRALDAIGVDVPYSVEVMSTEEQARPVAEAARRAHDRDRRGAATRPRRVTAPRRLTPARPGRRRESAQSTLTSVPIGVIG